MSNKINIEELKAAIDYLCVEKGIDVNEVKKAIEILKSSGESGAKISGIALDVGYASLSSFNKAFKELHGVTPSVYRNRLLVS